MGRHYKKPRLSFNIRLPENLLERVRAREDVRWSRVAEKAFEQHLALLETAPQPVEVNFTGRLEPGAMGEVRGHNARVFLSPPRAGR